MSNFFKFLGIFAIFAFAFPVYAQQYSPESDFQIYIDDASISELVNITGYNGSSKEVSIPPRIRNNPVMFIANEAFAGKQLTSVTIPDSVQFIGKMAFANNNLTSITIGANVTLDRTSFDNDFHEFYTNNGKKAGIYTYLNKRWSFKGKQEGNYRGEPNMKTANVILEMIFFRETIKSRSHMP